MADRRLAKCNVIFHEILWNEISAVRWADVRISRLQAKNRVATRDRCGSPPRSLDKTVEEWGRVEAGSHQLLIEQLYQNQFFCSSETNKIENFYP